MLKNEISKDPLYLDLKDIVSDLGLVLCYVKKSMQGTTVQIFVDIMNPEGETSIDDCAKVHNTILPRLGMKYGRDNLYVEVSTPGIQRNLRDVYELTLFKGKRCKIYSLSKSSWIEGIIGETDGNGVCLTDCEEGGDIRIEFGDIQKAKLEYKWEDMKNVRIK